MIRSILCPGRRHLLLRFAAKPIPRRKPGARSVPQKQAAPGFPARPVTYLSYQIVFGCRFVVQAARRGGPDGLNLMICWTRKPGVRWNEPPRGASAYRKMILSIYQIVDCVDAASSGKVPVGKPDAKGTGIASNARGPNRNSASFIINLVRVEMCNDQTCPRLEENIGRCTVHLLVHGTHPFPGLLCTVIVADKREFVNNK